jgi:hypothetical protein
VFSHVTARRFGRPGYPGVDDALSECWGSAPRGRPTISTLSWVPVALDVAEVVMGTTVMVKCRLPS